MQKVIGLDIGSYSIKAVEIVNTFKSYEIANFYENVIPAFDELSPKAVIPTCMEQLFAENQLVADRIVAAMPGQYISSRVLSFNFSDVQKVEASILPELEDAIPFKLEEMILDHQILGQSDGKTLALAVMTKKIFLAGFLEHLQRVNIDPKLVDVDSLALYNLCPYLPMEPGKVFCLLDIGHEKTSVCLVQDGLLKLFRSINLGGRYITEFLARDMEISFDSAQRLKHQVSQVITSENDGSSLSKEEKAICERITIACNSIIKELGRTFYAFKIYDKSPVEKVFLSGGTSNISQIETYLSEQLELEVVPTRLENSDLKINPAIVDKMPTMVQGIAIGIRAVSSVKRHSQINLRKGEFAYVQDYESILKVASYGAKVVAFALLLLCAGYALKYYSYTEQIDQLREVYNKDFMTILPQDQKKRYSRSKYSFERLRRDAKKILKERITTQQLATEGFIGVNSESGALVGLFEISKHIPKEVVVNVVEYRYEAKEDGGGKIRLRVEAESFETLAKFEAALREVPVLQVSKQSSDTKPGTELKIGIIEAEYLRARGEGV